MKKLLIVESPAKIKTISKFLGNEFKIMSTVGHIKDLPSKELGVTMNGAITIDYVTIKDKDKVIKDIVSNAKTSQEIYLAPDPDREGEIIAWHVEQEVKKYIKPEHIHRIAFNEITKPAITHAIQTPGKVDMQKVSAQQARRILDRWVGYEVSPILWRKVAKGLSAGRVQSVALKIICQRELEIRSFKPEEYWSIEGTFKHQKDTFNAALTHISKKTAKLTNEKDTNNVVEDLKTQDFIIESITDKKRLKNPYAPFITSTLQQAAANKIGFAVKKTMTLAQSMYEGITLQDPKSPQALITYMRTDSTRLSDTAIEQARNFINQHYGKEYLPAKAIQYAKKGAAQDAHEAIRPINIDIKPEDIQPYVSKDIFKLYQLIWTRAVACQMKAAIYAQRQVILQGGKYTFKVTGSTLTFDGFLKVYQEEESDDKKSEKEQKLPKGLKEKDGVDLQKIDPKQHFTQPPPKFSEATLVKELEKQGIGRPSTYATILNTIQMRNYVTLDKKRFVPTELGMKLTDILDQNFAKIMNVKFTAHMEEDLDKIAHGELDRDKLLKEFWSSFEKDLEKFKAETTKNKKTLEKTSIECPSCKKENLVIRLGKSGSFLGCPGFPECTFTANFKRLEDGTIQVIEPEQPETLNEFCPNCKSPLRKLQGRYGEFIACSGYPKCKYIKQNVANFPCPQCKGNIVQRKWRGGTFWGCANYPKCKFSIFSDIEQTSCPKCKQNPYMLKKTDKTGKVTLICPNAACKHTITA